MAIDYIEIGDRQQSRAQIAADNAFTARMMAAIDSQRETAIPGVLLNTKPLLATMFRSYAVLSGCGSPAAACAEQGEG